MDTYSASVTLGMYPAKQLGALPQKISVHIFVILFICLYIGIPVQLVHTEK